MQPAAAQKLDLLNQHWTCARFEEHALTVQVRGDKDPDQLAIVFVKNAPQAAPNNAGWSGGAMAAVSSWGSAVASSVWTTAASPKSVVERMDDFTQQEINVIAAYRRQVDRVVDPVIRRRHLEQRITQLQRLLSNLASHDEYVTKCNQVLYYKDKSIAACPTHAKLRPNLTAAIDILKFDVEKMREREPAMNAVEQKFRRELDDLLRWCAEGVRFSRQAILQLYSGYMAKIQTLPPEHSKDHLWEMTAVLNYAYLNGLVHDAALGHYAPPQFITLIWDKFQIAVITNLRYAITFGHVALSSKFETLLQEEVSKITPMPTLELLDMVQSAFLDIVIEKSGALGIQKARFRALFKLLHDLELGVREKIAQAEAATRTAMLSTIESKRGQILPREFERMQDFVKSFRFISPFEKVLQLSMSQISEFNLIFQAETDIFSANLRLLSDLFAANFPPPSALQEAFTAELQAAMQAASSHQKEAWVAANRDFCKFSVPDVRFAGNVVAGSNLAEALNQRWIKMLCQQPYPEVKSIDDLQDKTEIVDKMTVLSLSLEDKSRQKAVQVGSHYWSSISVLLHECGNGIFELKLYDMPCRSIGFQLEHNSRQIFRFWDTQEGFYQYPSFEQFSISFSKYVEAAYPKWSGVGAIEHT